MTAATGSYLEAEDAISAWIDEECERRSDAWESSSVLFASWKNWADKAGEPTGSMKRFVQCLENRGFKWRRQAAGRGFDWLALLQSEKQADDACDGSPPYRRYARA